MLVDTAVNPLESATSVEFEMPAPGSVGYDEWRKTGKLPSLAEDSAPPKEVIEQDQDQRSSKAEESATSESVTLAASEAAHPQKKKTADSRKAELNAEIRELARQAAELRETLAAARVMPESQPAKPSAEVKDKKPESRTEPQIDDKDDKGQPRYKTFGEYQADIRKWDREQAKLEALTEFESRQTKTLTEQQKTQKEQEAARVKEVITQGFRAKVDEARKKYPDYDKVAFAMQPDGKSYVLDIPEGSAMDQFILSSKYGTDTLYELGKNYDAVKHIFERNDKGLFKINPVDQLRELFKIEQGFVKPAAKPSAPRVTQAPPPPHQVSGKPSATVDEVEQAVNDGDFAAFQHAENERILAKRREGRRGK